MEMRGEGATARMATMAAFIWLFMMLVLTGSDYVTRAMAGG